MNIDDANINPDSAPKSAREIIRTMYARQCELIAKYKDIETRNGFPFLVKDGHLDDKHVQHRIKHNLWCTTEEIAEAFETLPEDWVIAKWRDLWAEKAELRHFFEELIDAIHFLLEASIAGGFAPRDISVALPSLITPAQPLIPGDDFNLRLREQAFEIIVQMGLAANCLKNKPWKQTHMPTDDQRFRDHLTQAWKELDTLFGFMDVNRREVWVLYMSKADVNTFRQRSEY
jgi:hypothetical protein